MGRADLEQGRGAPPARRRASDLRDPVEDLAGRLGPAARVLVVVEPGSAAGLTAEPVVGFFEAVGRVRDRTLVLDLAGPDSSVRRQLGAAAAPGLSDVLRGRTRVAEAVLRPPSRSFMYLPPGQDRLPGGRLIRALGAAGLLRRARERGGTVLLHVRADELETPAAWRSDVDGVVVPDEGHAGRIDPRLPVLGTLRPGSRPATPPAGDRRWPSSTPASPPRPRRSAPSSRSEMVFAADAPPLRAPRTRWWTILVICALAAALGWGILSATQDDSWIQDFLAGQDPVESTAQD